MDLYFTRHGKTEWNKELRFQGMTGDSPLLPSSYEEIGKLGNHLKKVAFKKIYSSTSLRARKTAEGLNSELLKPAEIIYTDELKELGLGKLEGQSIHEMRKLYANQMDNMRYHLDRYEPEIFGGEPIESAILRISGVVQQAIAAGEGPYLFVGHGASLTAGIQHLAGKDMSELRNMGGLNNNSLTILKTTEPHHQGPFKLALWNDDSFL
ncbi:histidine phosphatase family protein [Enterococcus sp. BWB1-3]|uniref:histidine phosphatase family protein n=1 Tax=unclassified Enterococcus TaxID=2608891 RepID=UPI0019239626|nr:MULTISPECIES: histidine phosphatase family protein [unclassified Enterococcus]MBL1229792.1 histidine phosphatase family protein [Enterococcus sp. BWB1-3]MCB5953027.1 histidine phosphatase family protein [Enterococcus sp. BWT-B8]MCB5955410.1 histidine phosphatase family protein [Enterococcus sp. CWB-B31]